MNQDQSLDIVSNQSKDNLMNNYDDDEYAEYAEYAQYADEHKEPYDKQYDQQYDEYDDEYDNEYDNEYNNEYDNEYDAQKITSKDIVNNVPAEKTEYVKPISTPKVEVESSDKKKKQQKGSQLAEINKRLFKRSGWDKLPMKRNNQYQNKIIRNDFQISNSLNHKTPLPNGYEWVDMSIESDHHVKEICEFLNLYYKLTPLQKHYDPTFIKWLFNPPTWERFLNIPIDKHLCCICVKSIKSNKLVGIITYRPFVYRLDNEVIQSFYIDFFCVHPKLRNKQLGWVLMKECHRRIEMFGATTGIAFHTHIHMPFNKIIQSSFVYIKNINVGKNEPTKDLNLIRFATQDDIPEMLSIYNKYAEGHRATQTMNRVEFEHYFLPEELDKDSFVHTYVITNSLGEIKDFVSFYAGFLPSTGQNVAFLNYISFINEVLLTIFMKNLFYIMNTNGFEFIVVNGNMGLDSILQNKLGFKKSDLFSNFYVFNYNTLMIPNEKSSITVIR